MNPSVADPTVAPVSRGNSLRRRLARCGLWLTLAAGATAMAGHQIWSRWTAPAPPRVELSHVDPDVAKAVGEARQMVERHPFDGAEWGRFGMVLHAHDFTPEALACYVRAEQLDRRNSLWPYLRSYCNLELDEAIPCVQRAVVCAEPGPEPRLRLGELLLERGRFEEARQHFEAVLTNDPRNARAHFDLGRLAAARGDLEAGVECLQRSLAIESRVRKTYDQLSAALHALGRKELAGDVRREADLRCPDEIDWPDSYLDQVKALETGPRAVGARANDYLRNGQPERALDTLRRFVQRRPESAPARAGLGRMLVLCDRPEEAVTELLEAIHLDPEQSIPHFYLGAAYSRLNRPHDAAPAFRQALVLQPNFSDALYELARTLHQLGERDEAIVACRECLRLNPNSLLGAKALAVFLAEKGEFEEALKSLSQAAQLAPKDPEIERMRQNIERQRGR